MTEGYMVETLPQLLLNTVHSFPKEDLLLYKAEGKYHPISTQQVFETIRYFSLGLKELGLSREDKLILLAENGPKWVMVDLATMSQGGITVPIYTSLTPEQILYIVDNSDAKLLVCSSPELWGKIVAIKDKLKKITKYIVFFDLRGSDILTFNDVLELGKKTDEKNPNLFKEIALSITPEDIASIIYTSGTTGVPKGVMLTHRNFVSNVTTCAPLFQISEKDTVLSFLPLSHVLERMVVFCYLYKGASIAFAESVETVAENLLEIRPHIMVSVPRVFEKIYARVMDNVLESSPLKRKIFFWALKIGRKAAQYRLAKKPLPRGLRMRHNLAHKLVFSKILERTGGRVRFFVSGGAPLSPDIAEFFYAIGLVILEGYGLTETSPVVSVNTFDAIKFGTVGKPLPGVEVKIAEDGEILVRGPNVMKGYYKMEAETQEAFADGWFHTGDIGFLDEEGYLVITDRKKDLIVTAGGKNVAPQPIENMIKTNPYISNVVVIGDKRKFVSALVVPEFEKLEEYARFNNIPFQSRKDLVNNEEIKRFVLAEIDRATPSLASYEKIKKIVLLEREFELEKGEITPTLKVRRRIIEEKYKDLIDALYRED
jgi:long-chain acyl-CoA synthetase